MDINVGSGHFPKQEGNSPHDMCSCSSRIA